MEMYDETAPFLPRLPFVMVFYPSNRYWNQDSISFQILSKVSKLIAQPHVPIRFQSVFLSTVLPRQGSKPRVYPFLPFVVREVIRRHWITALSLGNAPPPLTPLSLSLMVSQNKLEPTYCVAATTLSLASTASIYPGLRLRMCASSPGIALPILVKLVPVHWKRSRRAHFCRTGSKFTPDTESFKDWI